MAEGRWPPDGEDGVDDGTERLLADLAGWAAGQRADEAAGERAREHWLRRQAEEEATLAGLLVDLAEQQAVVVVRVRAGRRHGGHITAVGRDFFVLHTTAEPVVVALSAVTEVRPGPATPRRDPAGDRRPALDLSLTALLSRLAPLRPRVAVWTEGTSEVAAGDLRAVGADVMTVRVGGESPGIAHLPIAAVTEVVLMDASGYSALARG